VSQKDAPAEEALLRRVLDAVTAGVVYLARDGSIVTANREALRVLDFQLDGVQKRHITDFASQTLRVDGSPCPVEEYPASKALATGRSQPPMTIGVNHRDGRVLWAEFSAEPFRSLDGELTGVVVTFLDITERKHAEESLRRSEQRWRGLAENLPDFVIIGDRDLRILSINRVLPDYEEAKVIGASILEYIDEAHRVDYERAYREAFSTGQTVKLETRGVGPEGRNVWYEGVIVPLLAENKVDRALVVTHDVTERRAMLAGLAEKERLASVGMLAASVAHEVMNPLTYVLANLEFALAGKGDEARRKRALVEAREGARRMQEIVRDLRSLGRSGSEELLYVDPRGVVETAVRLSGPEVSRVATVILDLSAVPFVCASESRLCQVLINLLMNAAQALQEVPTDERRIRVETFHHELEERVGVRVIDNGPGIEGDHLERIFDAFYTTKRSGTGLGLSISRDMIERMGGTLEVASEPGKGATFTVWLSTTRDSAGNMHGSAARPG
jgi:PAS domain S-box-containing protein